MQYYVKIWQVDADKDNLPMYLPFQGYDRILRFSGEKKFNTRNVQAMVACCL